MRRVLWTTAAVLLGTGLIVTASTLFGQSGKKSDQAVPAKQSETKETVAEPLELIGKTQPAPGRSAKIAPVPYEPVEEIKVAVGVRVKKDQDLLKIDSDEQEARVRAKKASLAEMEASLGRLKEEPREEDQKEARAILESAKVSAREARELLERLEPAFKSGAVSEQKYIEVRALVLRSESDERSAQARLDKLLRRPFQREVAEIEARIAAAREEIKGAEAELEHYLMKSPIDGVVASLNVVLGEARGHETTVWGEIIDLKLIDVRCDVPPAQLDGIRLGAEALVLPSGKANGGLTGKVVNIGIAADRVTGHIPVLIRVENVEERLRCYISVKVRFDTTTVSDK